MNNVIAIHCQVMPDGTVIPDPGYAGPHTEQGPFRGGCSFDWMPERGTEPHLVIAKKTTTATAQAQASRPIWTPVISGHFEEEIFSGFRNVVWLVSSEPDPDAYRIRYGAGHLYRVVIEVNGEEVYAADHPAGDGSAYSFHYADHAAVPPYTATVSLYASDGGELLSSFTDT